MTLTELQAEVYTLTNRPDLTAQTLAAVRSATLKLHQLDYFYKDLFETSLVFSSSEFIQQLEFRSLVPRWRALKYIRKLDRDLPPLETVDWVVGQVPGFNPPIISGIRNIVDGFFGLKNRTPSPAPARA